MSDKKKGRAAEELLSTLTSAEESQHRENLDTEIVHREKLDDTPFYVIGNEEQGYFLAFGKFRLTEPRETIDEAKNMLYDKMWDIILKLVLCSHELVVENLHELAGKEEK